MAIRSDVHRPSAINPDDYDFVGFEYLKIEDMGDAMFLRAERERINRHRERTGGKYSNHQHGGTCHICGSVNAIYTALFYHKPSNVYIRTGLECAEMLDCGDVESFRRNVKSALEQKAGKRKAKAWLEQAGLSAAWPIYESEDTGGKYEERTIRDIVSKLVQYGSISDKAANFVSGLLQKIANRPAIEAKRAEEYAAAKPIPVTDGRVTIIGTIVAIRKPDLENDLFPCFKMTVKHADGWKVFGSVPKGINAVVGSTVRFDATVEVSNKDPKFGFFSRPSKAQIMKGVDQ